MKKYKLNIKGILHIGAHECEELPAYIRSGVEIENQLWIEAIPEKVAYCKARFPNVNIINAIVSDKDGEEVTFKVTNNYQSSSILNLKTHLIEHPHIYVIGTFTTKTKTIKTIFDENEIKYNRYNFINLDIQGTELLALKGMGTILNNFDYVYTEVNINELYEGCALLSQIDDYLAQFNLKRVETNMTRHGWGDAFYVRNDL